jgi:hypothetical protein
MPKLALVDINLKKELAYDLIEELHRQGVLLIVELLTYRCDACQSDETFLMTV